MVHLKENTVEGYAEYILNQESGVYDKVSVDAFNEALLLFTGKFSFGEEKEITEKSLSFMDGLFAKSDFVCAPFTSAPHPEPPSKEAAALTREMDQAFAAGYSMLYTSKSMEESVTAHFAPGQFVLDRQHPEYIININHIQIAFIDRRKPASKPTGISTGMRSRRRSAVSSNQGITSYSSRVRKGAPI